MVTVAHAYVLVIGVAAKLTAAAVVAGQRLRVAQGDAHPGPFNTVSELGVPAPALSVGGEPTRVLLLLD